MTTKARNVIIVTLAVLLAAAVLALLSVTTGSSTECGHSANLTRVHCGDAPPVRPPR